MNKSSYFFNKSGLGFDIWALLFFRPPLTSATSEVGWKTSNFNADFNVGKREEFGVPLSEIFNFEYWKC